MTTEQKPAVAKEQYVAAKRIFSEFFSLCKRKSIAMIIDKDTRKIARVGITYIDLEEIKEINGVPIKHMTKILPIIKSVWAKPIIQNNEIVLYWKDEHGVNYIPAKEII
jgi:hypothetical protein